MGYKHTSTLAVVILRDQAGVSTALGTGIYTSRHARRGWPDAAILTLNLTIAPVGRNYKWGVRLGDFTIK